MVIDDRDSYSTGLARSIIPLLRHARIRVDHESVSQSQTDFRTLIGRITLATGVVVLPWQIARNAELFGKQLARAHRRATIVGTDGVFSDAFTIAGSYVSSFAPDITALPEDRQIVQAAPFSVAGATFGPPSYAAADVIAQSIAAVCRTGQQPTRSNVLAQIKATDTSTSILGEPIRFAANGELEGAHWFLYKVTPGGKYRMLPAAIRP